MSHFQKICLHCEAVIDDPVMFHCPSCGGDLGFRYDTSGVQWDNRFTGSMWRYWRMLPIDNPDALVTLGEGGTPLHRSRLYGDHTVYLKDEMRNPTGSHKDRPLSLAVNHAKVVGAQTSFVVSSGSTGISNAALSAKAGLRSVIMMTSTAPTERIYPLFALGATIVQVHGDVDMLVDEVIRICQQHGLYLSSTSRKSNPYQAEAPKTIAYEIFEQLGDVPDWILDPVGGGGTISGIWRGFKDLKVLGMTTKLPRLVGVVPRPFNALEVAFERGLETWDDVLALPYHDIPPSILVKLMHAYPPDGMEALECVRESGGFFASVTDDDAVASVQRFGGAEGLYIEPSTAVCVPVIDRMIADGTLKRDETLVAMICGSGFRETFLMVEKAPLVKQTITPDQLESTLVALR